MEPSDVEFVRRLASSSTLKEIGGGGWMRSPRPLEPIVLCVVRNERLRIGEFLTHHRSLGLQHFAIVDNGSTDGTRDLLLREPEVRLFDGLEPFSWQVKHGWIMSLVETFGRDRWYLLVDADEHCVFDGSDCYPLSYLVNQLELLGVRRTRGAIIDMYREGPILTWGRPADVTLTGHFNLFDAGTYREHRSALLTSRVGGPRKRVMGHADATFQPELTKYPLFKPTSADVAYNPHVIWPPVELGDDPCRIGLLHYKFDDNVLDRLTDAIVRRQYWNASAEYQVYLECLRRDPAIGMSGHPTRVYRTPADLVEHGLITQIDDRPRAESKTQNLAAAIDHARRTRRANALRVNRGLM